MNQYAVEDNSNMPPQLGSDDTADRQQAEPTTIPINSSITPEPAGNNNQIADEAANSRLRQDAEMGIVINRQDFELLWRLRKYLLLLAMLSVSVTYVAGLSPPGGFWTDNRNHHHAGDPLLPVAFFERYEVFFYCNATAFAASLVLIILLLSRGVSSQQVWLRSMQVTMILDLFSLMGAFAAGSCRALRSSSYILALVLAVFLYVGIHILVFMRVVPKRLKEMVQNFLQQIEQMTSQNGHVPEEQSSIQNEDEEIEEARKFILMLATFAATITYQAGMSPPGGFWAENNGYGYRPATFVLRRHNLHRFNIFICCNATSFVASLGTIILLLSTKLSMHGIRTQALSVCVIADLLSLIGAYAAGCCRDVATSLFVIFIIAIVLICVLILVIFFQSKPVTMWIDKEVKPRFDKFLTKLSWPRERHLSNAKQYDSQPTHPRDTEQSSLQQDTEHLNCDTEVQVGLFNAQCHSSDNHLVSTEDMTSASTSGFNSMKGNMTDMLGQSHDQNEHVAIRTVRSASEDALITKEVPMSSMEEKSAGSQQDAIPKETSSSSDGVFFLKEEDSGEVTFSMNDNADNSQAAQPQERGSNDNDTNPDDVRLKSRTYLLLLAILAVSLTYQAGLNPPGGFWTSNTSDHSAGDPILEDNYHKRYLAFFYFNATAFAASLIMIIMLLNRKMSNKVIKRRALQTAMITDLLALMGAFVVGSCREKTKSIYISVVIFAVVSYVPLHVLVSRHVIPKQWKECVAKKLKRSRPEPPRIDNNKDMERRRNLLFILAILSATVTYQAGLSPPGGTWPEENSKDGKPGNPVLQDNHPKRYNVFYYSNAASFVSSVAVIILLVNRESCEHGIKSYALRACLVTGLFSLLIAYSAGSVRKAKSVIYLVCIAVTVLICLVIQVLLLSSTQGALEGPLEWLRTRFHISLEASDQANTESNAVGSVRHVNEKERKRHKYLMLLANLAASIAYQAGLSPPGGFWSDDNSPHGYKAGKVAIQFLRTYTTGATWFSLSSIPSLSWHLFLLSCFC